MSKQLFHLLREVEITHDAHYNPILNEYSSRRLIAPATFAVVWPDGNPCSLAEVYLISCLRQGASVREDGGSLRATVAKLSHLIRYCWDIKKDFWELDDEDVYQFVLILMGEKKPKSPMVRARDNNTVRLIIAAAVSFLLWLQAEVLWGIKLIGVGKEFSIHLLERKVFDSYQNRRSVQRVYHRLPPKDTKEPKRPISREKRDLLWAAVGKLATATIVAPRWARNQGDLEFLLDYLKVRRELLLELLEATGARPGELSRLSVLANEGCYKSQVLVLTTLKRRRDIERKIKLQPGVAMRLTVFLGKYRGNLLKLVQASGAIPKPNDRVFLGSSGCPMSERTMTSDFYRISKAAGLTDYQNCMSMFRHRYITKQVAIHLGIYLSENNKVATLMTDGDYRSILKKVATTTGHGSELSLLHYLDLAWEELNTNDQIAKAAAIDSSIESTVTQVISLIGNVEKSAKSRSDGLILNAVEILKRLQVEIQSGLKITSVTKLNHPRF